MLLMMMTMATEEEFIYKQNIRHAAHTLITHLIYFLKQKKANEGK